MLIILILFEQVHCGDDDGETDPKAQKSVNFESQINALSGKIDDANSKFEQFNSEVGKKIKNIDLANKQRLINLETTTKLS